MQTTIRTILFDFDYTLADSSRGAVDCIQYALAKLGLSPATEERARQTIGLSLTETLVQLAGPQYAEQGAEFSQLFVQRADQVMVEKTILFPSVPEAVDRLKRCDIALGIVSTKFRYRIEETLRRDGLLDRFDIIVGGEDVSHHKPDPEGLLWALERLGISREQALYVGDSVVDAETARRAAVPFAAVLSGVTPREMFGVYAPCWIVEDMAELVDRLGYR